MNGASTSSSNTKGKMAVKGSVKQEEEEDPMQLSSDTAAKGLAVTTAAVGDRTDAVAKTQAGERFLKAIRDTWDDHCACMSTLRDVFKYVVSEVSRIWPL